MVDHTGYLLDLQDPAAARPIHPFALRVMHRLNVVAIVTLIGSGWEIYDASPFLPSTFPGWMTIGGWLGGAIAWNLAAIWLLMLNGLAVFGRVGHKWVRTVAKLRAIPQHSRITRLIGGGGWPAIDQWGGVQLSDFLHAINADTRANYVSMQCANGFLMSVDMEPGRHPQTILALDFLGAVLIPQFGAPMRLRIPTKFGLKNAKSIISMGVTNKWTENYLTKQGYNLFGGS